MVVTNSLHEHFSCLINELTWYIYYHKGLTVQRLTEDFEGWKNL